MEKTTQKTGMRYTDDELKFIQAVFFDREDLLRSLQKSALGFPLDEKDALNVRTIGENKALMAILRKEFLPEIATNLMFGTNLDLWMTVKVEGLNPADAVLALKARAKLIELIKQCLTRFESGTNDIWNVLDFSPVGDEEEVYINFIARNFYINHVESRLMTLHVLASHKPDTPEVKEKKKNQDSTK